MYIPPSFAQLVLQLTPLNGDCSGRVDELQGGLREGSSLFLVRMAKNCYFAKGHRDLAKF
jgi:hypothetical protein